MSVDEQFQRHTCTEYGRNVGLFVDLRLCLADVQHPRILSFGCSDGSECLTIKRHVPAAVILGCDVNRRACAMAQEKVLPTDIAIFPSSSKAIEDKGPYDAILAFSVLCRWPLEPGMDNIAQILPFGEVEAAVAHLVHCLKPQGVLGLFNSAYFLEDMACAVKLEAVPAGSYPHNGFVFRHLADGRLATTSEAQSATVVHRATAPLQRSYNLTSTYWRKSATQRPTVAANPRTAVSPALPKRVGLVAPPHTEVVRSFEKSTDQLWPAANNLGNCMFRYAVASHLENHIYLHEGLDPGWVRDNVDVLCLPLANFLSPYATNWLDWKMSLSRFIKACGLPVIVVGMGAQAPDMTTAGLPLMRETVECAHVLADHATMLGVRGQFTADVLSSIGIKNVDIIGCPSHFIASSPSIGQSLAAKYGDVQTTRIAASGSDLKDDPPTKLVQQKLIQYVVTYRGFYHCQAPEYLISLARGRFGEVPPERLEEFRRHLASDMSTEQFIALVRSAFLSFLTVESWLEFLAGCDLYIGMRIHGAIAAIQAQTPAVCVAHDSRTQELCDTLAIPSVSSTGLFDHRSLTDIFARATFDGAAFDRNRTALAHRYRSLFYAVGVECRIGLLQGEVATAAG